MILIKTFHYNTQGISLPKRAKAKSAQEWERKERVSREQQQQFITKKSDGQQRSEERKMKSIKTQLGIREREQEKRRKLTGKKQKGKKGRK